MIKFLNDKIYNAYLIESSNYNTVKDKIMDLAINNGFDRKLVEASTHPDIVTIECIDKIIPIADLRTKIIDKVYYTPKVAERKFYIISDAKNLSEASQNAMLKTLEEPPWFVSFFLISNNVNAILSTIKSRCQLLKDTDDINYKELLSVSFFDDALLLLANIKYIAIYEKMNFVENAIESSAELLNLIRIYRLAIRDALLYKITLSKKNLLLREKEDTIISIANSLNFEEFGMLSDGLDKLSLMDNYNVNKKLAAFNFLNI